LIKGFLILYQMVNNACQFVSSSRDPDPFQSIYLFVAEDNGRVFKVC
jgi:hypothetical protein